MATAISFENISKQYRLGLVSTKTLSHDLNRWWQTSVLKKDDPYLKIGDVNNRATKGTSDYVWALRNITFDVQEGDVVGIIGKNGAGKSTLLKILSKVTAPTTGAIKAKGRIASLLEVGTGFHGEMTGRENIYMNGAILGMTKPEIARKLDEIVDFSGIERYIDTPVKRYSSGMTVRLGFAVAAHLDPEILVVDEVLAVGDAEFQKKAIGKMQDVSRGEGRTVLFVSHNMASMRQLCKTGILLKDGSVEYAGKINEVVEYYVGNSYTENPKIYFDDISTALGNENIKIKSFEVAPTEGDALTISSGITMKLLFYCNKKSIVLDVSYQIYTIEDFLILGEGVIVGKAHETQKGLYSLEITIPKNFFNSGKYRINIWFGENNKYCLYQMPSQIFTIEDSFNRNSAGLLQIEFEKKSAYTGTHF
ncbi:MAG: ATP-binding cassette domain-containing protein [Prevotellaceae bacterium]|jgi:lipopolysaccharide transport system ATP-binding protein|nr:ATP-binding cassette domain-containing protein [Prevotellaceae bacterium]